MSELLTGHNRPVRSVAEKTAEILEQERSYNRIVFTPPAPDPANQYVSCNPVNFSYSGDHLYCHKIVGGGLIQVRFGRNRNPWIDVAEGMVLTRVFDSFSIRDASKRSKTGTSAVFYSSQGPLVSRPYKTHGLKLPLLCTRFTGTITNAWQSIENCFGGANKGLEEGWLGNQLYVKNIDLANTLLIDSDKPIGVAPGASQGFPLLPGEQAVFDLDDKVSWQRADDNTVFSLVFACASPGTVDIALMCNGKSDFSDPDFALNAAVGSTVLEMDR